MKHLVCSVPGRVELIETAVPAINSDELLVRVSACGLCGTDLLKVYSQSVHKLVQLGHEIVGAVENVGADVGQFERGQRVAVAHHVPDYSSHYSRRGSEPMDALFKSSNIVPGGFAEFVRVPGLHVNHTVLRIPGSMPDMRAVFMEPLACCLRALNRVSLVAGDTVLIVGVGAVGMLFVPLCRDRSATVLVSDLRAERLSLAQTWGATAGFLAGKDDVATGCRRFSANRGADLVVLSIVNRHTFNLALDAIRDGGTVLLFGTKPDEIVALNLWDIWRREINLISSYSTTPDLLLQAMALLGRSEYAFESLVSHKVPLADGPAGFELAHKGQVSKVVIIP